MGPSRILNRSCWELARIGRSTSRFTLLPGSRVPIPDIGEIPEHLFRIPGGSKARLYMRLKVTRK